MLIVEGRKTILSSTIIEDLLQELPEEPIAYFYFDFNDSTKQYTDKMLRSLTNQLFSDCQPIPEPVVSLFKSCQDGDRQPRTQDLLRLLSTLICSSDRTFIVLDALDECEDREELIDSIMEIVAWVPGRLNLIMTSREIKDLATLIDSKLGQQSRTFIQNERVDDDIRSYVHSKLQNSRHFERWQPAVRTETEQKLAGRSDGM